MTCSMIIGQKYIDNIRIEGGAEIRMVNIMPYKAISVPLAGEKPQETQGVTLTSFPNWPATYPLSGPLNIQSMPAGGLEVVVRGMIGTKLNSHTTSFDRMALTLISEHNTLVIKKDLVARLDPVKE